MPLNNNPIRAKAFLEGPFAELCTPAEMAEILNIDDSAIRQAIKSGRLVKGLDCIQLGKQWVLSRSAWPIMSRYGVTIETLKAKCRQTIEKSNNTVS